MKKRASSLSGLLLPIVAIIALLALQLLDPPPLRSLRNNVFDQYQRWHPRAYEAAPVRIIDIDEESLARLGQWPWPRTRIAELVDRLSAGGAAAIAFDIVFAEPDRTSPQAAAGLWPLPASLGRALRALPDHDTVLAEHFAAADNVVLGFALERGKIATSDRSTAASRPPARPARFINFGELPARWLHEFSGAVPSLPGLEKAAKGNGALTFVPDNDGVVRRVPLVLAFAGEPVPTLVSEALRVGQGTTNIILKSAGSDVGLDEVRIGEPRIPTTPHGEIWVHYSLPVAERYVPAWRVFAGEVPAEAIDGHLVLVGSSAQGLMDLRFSPLGRIMPGVEAHAQGLEQILTGHFLQRPGWARGFEALVLALGGLLIGSVALRARALAAAAATAVLLAGLLAGGWYAFVDHDLLLDTATPTIGLLLVFMLASLYRHFASEREQRWIRNAFARYVSPNRVSHLVDHPDDMELGGHRQECSFIFTDLAGFTTLMEKIDPGEAVALLNAYLDHMIGIAFRHEGTLDRIVGDAVAIMFSAPVEQPDHRARALACALDMDTFAAAYSRELQDKGIAFGKTRIGIHSGEVIVGNFGGTTIFDYRALGDPVNTASRLEAVNKHLGTRICVSQATLSGCPDARVRPVGRLVLKGKSESLQVFEPLTADQQAARAPLADYGAAYAAMRDDAPDALARFDTLAATHPDDPLVALHRQRLAAGEHGDLIIMSEK